MINKQRKRILTAALFLLASVAAFCHTVNDDNVRVRTLPSLKYSQIVKKLNHGDKIDVMSRVTDEDGNKWYEFYNENYDSLWIFANFVDMPELDRESMNEKPRTQIYASKLDSEMYDIAIKDSVEKTFAEVRKSTPIERLESGINNHEGPIIKTEYLNYRTDYGTVRFLNIPSQNVVCLIDACFEKDFPNSFGIKMGDSIDKIKRIFGNTYTDEFTLNEKNCFFIRYVNSEFDGLMFTLDGNERIVSIRLTRNGGLGN